MATNYFKYFTSIDTSKVVDMESFNEYVAQACDLLDHYDKFESDHTLTYILTVLVRLENIINNEPIEAVPKHYQTELNKLRAQSYVFHGQKIATIMAALKRIESWSHATSKLVPRVIIGVLKFDAWSTDNALNAYLYLNNKYNPINDLYVAEAKAEPKFENPLIISSKDQLYFESLLKANETYAYKAFMNIDQFEFRLKLWEYLKDYFNRSLAARIIQVNFRYWTYAPDSKAFKKRNPIVAAEHGMML